MRRSLSSVPATLLLAAAATSPAAAQDTSHPAGLHVGSCPVPGNAVVSLWDASPNFLVDGEAEVGEAVGSEPSYPVEGSVTVVDIPLAELIETEHAILVHRSQAEMDAYLACGDIGGVMTGPDELVVALAPVGLSAWSGIAILDDEGDGTTTISIHVFEGPGIDTAAVDVPTGPSIALDDDAAADWDADPRHKADKDVKDVKEKDKDREARICHFAGHNGDFLIGDDVELESRCEDILAGHVIAISVKALDAHLAT